MYSGTSSSLYNGPPKSGQTLYNSLLPWNRLFSIYLPCIKTLYKRHLSTSTNGHEAHPQALNDKMRHKVSLCMQGHICQKYRKHQIWCVCTQSPNKGKPLYKGQKARPLAWPLFRGSTVICRLYIERKDIHCHLSSKISTLSVSPPPIPIHPPTTIS